MNNKLCKNALEINIKMLKELGYILLLIVFFIGIILGSLNFKGVSLSNFELYEGELRENLTNLTEEQKDAYNTNVFLQGIKTIIIFWIIGMSAIGAPILVIIVGYKGFSVGYTISTILKLLGTLEGNKFVFQNMFLENVIMVFIMIFMANYSMRILKNFVENKENLKVDIIKYTVISVLLAVSYILIYIVSKIFI